MEGEKDGREGDGGREREGEGDERRTGTPTLSHTRRGVLFDLLMREDTNGRLTTALRC